MPEIDEKVKESLEQAEGGRPLNMAVAILVALTATVLALCHIKDGNLIKEMSHAQAQAVDTWSFYQAKSIKQHLTQFQLEQTQMTLDAGATLTAEARAKYTASATKLKGEAERYNTEKDELQKKAKEYEEDYARMDKKHEQFDMADAFFSIAIAMAGITALTRQRWLLGVALALSFVGFLFGLAGFMGWSLYSDALAKLFGA